MTKEDKDLLLHDLCARLPYRVRGNYQNSDDELLRRVTIVYRYLEPNGMVMTGDIKPYLFPISSMTSKQRAELSMLVANEYDMLKSFLIEIEFYHKHHFDYRGLIEKGLAIDATGKNIY